MGYRLAGCRLLQQIKRSREKELFDMENKQEKGRFNFKKETYLLQIKGKSERNRKNHLHGKKKEKNI